MISYYLLSLSFIVNIVNIPFENGANIRGSSKAFEEVKNDLTFLNIGKIHDIECENVHVRQVLSSGYQKVEEVLNKNEFPLTFGGDHTISISSISACNDYCKRKNLKLGIVWFDAHADFNTIETSPSGNLHGVPVSVLCGHTLKFISLTEPLDTEQFCYHGVRDFDSQEFIRFQEYNMTIAYNTRDFLDFINNFDRIHISFDLDCLDPSFMHCVNTKIPNGLMLKDVIEKLILIKDSGKLISMDIVEYNPIFGDNTHILIKLINFLSF